jgi:hypothetical protein
MTETKDLKHLLQSTGKIIKHQSDLEKVKGEKFNVFSILGLERNENRTHSAFLAELLNPFGSHLMGNKFLEYFLGIIPETAIDIKTVKVKTEHDIGPRDDEKKTGGRIDIYLWDRLNNCISIENKIYAPDQFAQIERYCNFSKAQNKVFYLTLDGHEPLIESKGSLESNEDYFILSYKEHVLPWLKKCFKDVGDLPLLRESIRQYILLIQKLTFTMENNLENELIKEILIHGEEAAFIAENFIIARQSFGDIIRQSVFQGLAKVIDKSLFSISLGDNKFSQIWIKLKGNEASDFCFGIESFIGNGPCNKCLYIGIFNWKKEAGRYSPKSVKDLLFNEYWQNVRVISDFNQIEVNFANPKTISKLYNSENLKEDCINHIIKEVLEYLNEYAAPLIAFIEAHEVKTPVGLNGVDAIIK